MGWKRKAAIGVPLVLLAGYAGLAFATREPDRPVARLPVAGGLLLSGGTVVDPRTGALSPDTDVLMRGGRIAEVGRDLAATEPGIRQVDARGRFVAPGYNDMHAHPLGPDDPSRDLALMLAAGITGFRQMSGSDAILRERREGRLPLTIEAPALLATPGALLTPLNASKPADARASVRHQKAGGADFIKVGLVDEPALFAALDEGRRVGLPVGGHVPTGASVLAAARRGMRAVEHLGPGNGLLIACSSEGDRLLAAQRRTARVPHLPAIDSRIVDKLAERLLAKLVINPAAASREAGAIEPLSRALATFDEARCRRIARGLRAAGNWQVPTLIRLKTIARADDPAFAANPELRFMPPDTVAAWRDAAARFSDTYSPTDRAVLRRGYQANLRLVKLLDEEGVPLLAGSDASGAGWEVPGAALHREFDELARAGLAPLRILQMTTSDAAAFLGRAADMGAVAPGRTADLVLLDGDPTASAANLHRIAGVVRAGFYLDRGRLAALKRRVAAGGGHLTSHDRR